MLKMDLRGKTSSDSHRHDRAENCSGTKDNRCRTDADLEIGSNILSDGSLRALLDEWIVPVVVEGIIRDLWNCEQGERT